jgi:hypothetical protein
MKKTGGVLLFIVLASSAILMAQAMQQPSLEQLKAATVTKPSDPTAWENLGLGYAGANQYPEAIEALKKAVDLNYNPPVGKYNLACVYARQGTPESKRMALSLLKEIVAAGGGAGLPIASDPDLTSLKNEPDFQQLVQSMRAATQVCKEGAKHPEYRALDFWVGEWDVYAPQHVKVGESSVQLILGDCVVFENWTALGGSQGKSFNKYNTQTKKWEQYWVDDQGHTTFYSGDSGDNQVRYAADSVGPNGAPLLRHLTFTKLEADKVEQKEDVSSDNGKTWSVGYDFIYVRKNSTASASQGSVGASN